MSEWAIVLAVISLLVTGLSTVFSWAASWHSLRARTAIRDLDAALDMGANPPWYVRVSSLFGA